MVDETGKKKGEKVMEGITYLQVDIVSMVYNMRLANLINKLHRKVIDNDTFKKESRVMLISAVHYTEFEELLRWYAEELIKKDMPESYYERMAKEAQQTDTRERILNLMNHKQGRPKRPTCSGHSIQEVVKNALQGAGMNVDVVGVEMIDDDHPFKKDDETEH